MVRVRVPGALVRVLCNYAYRTAEQDVVDAQEVVPLRSAIC